MQNQPDLRPFLADSAPVLLLNALGRGWYSQKVPVSGGISPCILRTVALFTEGDGSCLPLLVQWEGTVRKERGHRAPLKNENERALHGRLRL